MSNFEHRITEDSTEFEKAFLKIYDGNLWTALDKMKDWQPPKQLVVVPQIVADFIVVRKGELKLYDAFKEIEECYGGEFYDWVFKYSCGDLLFARAWNDGYTVEKENRAMKEIMTCEICGCSFVDVESEDYTEVFTTGLCCECILEELR